jgi:hypothetical protein
MVMDITEENYIVEDANEKRHEELESPEIPRELRNKIDLEMIRALSKFHIMPEHPSSAALSRALATMEAPREWIKRARPFNNEKCLKRSHPHSLHIARLPRAKYFNGTVDSDIFKRIHHDKVVTAMTIMDDYSRFEADAKLKQETATREIEVLGNTMDCMGRTMRIRSDMSSAHMIHEYKEWAERQGINNYVISEDVPRCSVLLERKILGQARTAVRIQEGCSILFFQSCNPCDMWLGTPSSQPEKFMPQFVGVCLHLVATGTVAEEDSRLGEHTALDGPQGGLYHARGR